MGVYGDGKSKGKSKGEGKGRQGLGDVMARLGSKPRGGARADWGDVSPDLLASLVCAVTRRGGACSLGMSRDRAVLNVTIFMDGERATRWIDEVADAETIIVSMIELVEALPED